MHRLRSRLRALLPLGLAIVAGGPARGEVHALLINGGARPESNYLSHFHHLEDMVGVLERRGVSRERITVFSADGEDKALDLAVRDVLPGGFWLVDGLGIGKQLRPRTEQTDTRWPGMPLHPATQEALRAWFASSSDRLRPGDRLLVFVTDHGIGNDHEPDNGAISLWRENLTVREFREMLGLLPEGASAVVVMSQCYSGTFAAALYDLDATSAQRCGFFSTRRDLPAYGCYPEGRDRDRLGHAFAFVSALERNASTDGAHRDVLVEDDTPDVPLRTSDAFLEQVLAREAERRGESPVAVADPLLAKAWSEPGAWEPEIRLLDGIAAAFGMASPRSLAEIEAHEADLAPFVERMETWSERWTRALLSVKQEVLASFLEERDDWKAQVAGADDLDPRGRRDMLQALLPQLEAHARERTDSWSRLEKLRDRAERASAAEWRLEVRRAALRRARLVLQGIAARSLLESESADPELAARRQGLARLESCEDFEPGALALDEAARPETDRPAFPPLAADRALLEELRPSWLGVRFGPIPQGLRSGRLLPPGGVYLRSVYPDSPAHVAGLEPGDIIVGPKRATFRSLEQIVEWTVASPVDVPLELRVVRPSDQEDRSFTATVKLVPFPFELPEPPQPPEVGEKAPALPQGLESVGSAELATLAEREHVLVFWATWCEPCKAAVPELLAFAAARQLPLLAISDEDAATVRRFLDERSEPFFRQVVVDPLRRSFLAYGVDGTPSVFVVDPTGRVRLRQVGYNVTKGLGFEGWDWAPPAQNQRPAAK